MYRYQNRNLRLGKNQLKKGVELTKQSHINGNFWKVTPEREIPTLKYDKSVHVDAIYVA